VAGKTAADVEGVDKGCEVKNNRGFTANKPKKPVSLRSNNVIFARSGKFRANIGVTVPG